MGWLVFEICINAYQSFLMVFFLRNRLRAKYKVGIYDILCGVCITLFFSSYLFFDNRLPDTFVFLLPLVYTLVCYQDKWYIKVFWLCMLAITMTAVVNMMISIFASVASASWEEIMAQETMLRFTFVMACNIALTLIVYLVTKLKRHQSSLSIIALVVLFIQNVAYMFLLEFLFAFKHYIHVNDTVYFLSCIGTFICSCSSFILYEILSINAEREHNYQQEISMMHLTARHQEDLKGVYSLLLTREHDLKHQIQVVEQLIYAHKYPEGQALLNEIESLVQICQFSTGNLSVDALLTAKFNIMQQKKIILDYSIHPILDLPLSDAELCSVIGNILDNAIEAIERISFSNSRTITFSIERAQNMYYITCSNPVDITTIRRYGGRYLSSKNSTTNGLGISNIQRVIESIDGECHISIKHDLFTIIVSIYGN